MPLPLYYDDPVAELRRRVASSHAGTVANPLRLGDEPTKFEQMGGPMPEEEQQSLMAKAGDFTMGAVEGLGYALDTPGAYLRGVLGGQPGERISGRQMLTNWGLASRNRPGLHFSDPADLFGDVAGFAAEVLFDPLLLIAGPGKAFTSAGAAGLRALGKAGGKPALEAAMRLGGSIPETIRAVKAGERGMIGLRLPGIPFLTEGTPLGAIGTGERAGKLLESIYYGKYSPIPYLRSKFTKHLDSQTNTDLQRFLDERNQFLPDEMFESNKIAAEIKAKYHEAYKPAYEAMLQHPAVASIPNEIARRYTADRAVKAMFRQDLEMTDDIPSVEGITKQLIESGATTDEAEAKAAATLMRTTTMALARANGVPLAQQFHKMYAGIQRGDISELYGLNWAKTVDDKGNLIRPNALKTDQIAFHNGKEHESGYFIREIRGEHPRWELHRGKLALGERPPLYATEIEAKNAAALELAALPDSDLSPLDAAILKRSGVETPQGLVQVLQDGRTMLHALKGSDINTVLRSVALTFRRHMPDEMKDAASKWLGVSGEWTKQHEDTFAKAFERYIFEGQAPNGPMAMTLEAIARGFEDTVKEARVAGDLGPEAREIFGKLFDTNPDGSSKWMQSQRNSAAFTEAARDFYHKEIDELNFLGANLKALDDTVNGMGDKLGFAHRRITKGLLDAKTERELRRGAETKFDLVREGWLRGLPGGTDTINRMTIDPLVSGTNWAKQEDKLAAKAGEMLPGPRPLYDAEEAAVYLTRTYGVPPEKAVDVAKKLAKLPLKMVREQIPLFNNHVGDDLVTYAQAAAKYKSQHKAIWRALDASVAANKDGLGVPLSEVWADIGLSEDSLKDFLTKQLGAGGEIADRAVPLAPDALVDTELASAMKRYMSAVHNREEAGAFTKLLDASMGMWKAGQTVAWPAFHFRNHVSAMWTNWVARALNSEGLRKAWDVIFKDGDREAWNELLESGALGKHKSFTSTLLDTGDNLDDTLVEALDTTPFKYLTTSARSAVTMAREGGFTGKMAAAPTSFMGLPFNNRNFSLQEWGSHGKLRYSGKEALVNGVEKGPRDLALAFGESSHELIEAYNRAVHYFSLRHKGWSPHAAAASVKKWHFDYSEVSSFERRVMKRIFPFYGWIRNNIPLQVSELIGYPGGRTAQSIRLVRDIIQESKAVNTGWVPSWLGEEGSIPLGRDRTGTLSWLAGNPLPIVDLNNIVLPGAWDAKMAALTRTGQNVLSMMRPEMRYLTEEITGTQLYTGRPLQFLRADLTGNRQLENMLLHSPASRAMTTWRKMLDDRKSTAATLTNFLTSFRLTQMSPEDIPKWMMTDALNIVKAIQRSNPHIRTMERVYVDDIKALDPETLEMVRLYEQNRREYEELRRLQKNAEKVKAVAGQ